MSLLKTMWAYLNHSNLKISFDCNPFVWSFRYMGQDATDTDPDLYIRYIRILPLGIILTIDSGRCNVVLPEEDQLKDIKFGDGVD